MVAFRYPDKVGDLACSSHQKEGMVHFYTKMCAYEVCTTLQFHGETVRIYCSKHKSPKMILLGEHQCPEAGCKKKPLYNNPGEKVGLFCAEHKSSSMINVITKQCDAEGCTTQPSFNYIGERGGIRCFNHREKDMINVQSLCDIDPCFNIPGLATGIYCFSHKTVDMVNVKSKICEHLDCRAQSKYNYPGNRPCFCLKHNTKTMIISPTKKMFYWRLYRHCNPWYFT